MGYFWTVFPLNFNSQWSTLVVILRGAVAIDRMWVTVMYVIRKYKQANVPREIFRVGMGIGLVDRMDNH